MEGCALLEIGYRIEQRRDLLACESSGHDDACRRGIGNPDRRCPAGVMSRGQRERQLH